MPTSLEDQAKPFLDGDDRKMLATLTPAQREYALRQLLALLQATNVNGVTSAEHNLDANGDHVCHCNNDDCPHCTTRVAHGIELVMAAHARLYPAIRDAYDATKAGYMNEGLRELLHKQSAQIADLTAQLANLAPTGDQTALAARLDKLTDMLTSALGERAPK